MLQGNHFAAGHVQDVRRLLILLEIAVFDLQPDGGRVVVALISVRHGNDAGWLMWPQLLDRLLQISREGSDAAAARERIPDEREPAEWTQRVSPAGRGPSTEIALALKCARARSRAMSSACSPLRPRSRSGAETAPA